MNELLHHYLEAAAAKRPRQVAVIDRGRRCTYAELDARANALARVLSARGVRPGDRVGLYLEKGLESIVGLYGVLKVGAAYVPLDPRAPAPRLAYMLGKCGIEVLVTSGENRHGLARLAAAGTPLRTLVVPDERGAGELRIPGLEAVGTDAGATVLGPTAPPTAAEDLAYVLFTSGSTGNPKGVMLSHANGRAFVDWAVERFRIGASDRLANHAPLHFDLSVLDVFGAAAARATLVLVPPTATVFPAEIPRFINENQITVWYSVPSVLTRMVQQARLAPGACASLRLVLFAGEPFPVPYLDRLMRAWSGATFANLYGPTETNVCTFQVLPGPPGADAPPVGIGQPIAGVEVFLLAEDQRPVRPGEPGELCVRGPTVMLGYWDEPELTTRALTRTPGPGGDRVYRTGDLARLDSEGNYHLLGRRDHQVKSRGYRIELGEIEAALYRHPAVLAATVVAVPDQALTNQLTAFVVLAPGATAGNVTDHCAALLPAYMVPDHVEPLPRLPTTSTGKVDRQQLAAWATTLTKGGRAG